MLNRANSTNVKFIHTLTASAVSNTSKRQTLQRTDIIQWHNAIPEAHIVVFSAPTKVDDRKSVDLSKHMRANGENASEVFLITHAVLSATHISIVKLQRLRTTIFNFRKIQQYNEMATKIWGSGSPKIFTIPSQTVAYAGFCNGGSTIHFPSPLYPSLSPPSPSTNPPVPPFLLALPLP